MRRRDLVPLKVVIEDLGVSRITLWRATQSKIEGFPPPTIIRRLVYWKRSELDQLEEALMRYQGRVKFERGRTATQKIERLRKKVGKAPRRRRSPPAAPQSQPDLFSRPS